MMKRIITAALAVAMMVTLTACGAQKADTKNLEGKTSEIIEKVYAEKTPDIGLMSTDVDLNDAAALKSFTGLDSADKLTEVTASEAMISAQAYSLVMVRVKDAKDAKEVAEAMKAGIDTRKWICVEADDLAVAGYGDVVMLVMVDSGMNDVATSADMVNAFKTVCGGTLSFEL